MNNLMKKRLKGRNILVIAKKYPLEPKLKEIIDKGVVIQDGIAVLKWRMRRPKIKKYTPDLIQLEWNFNEFPIDLFISKKKLTREYVLQQGIAFALALKEKLLNKHSKSKFNIILITDEIKNSDTDIKWPAFYTVRHNEKKSTYSTACKIGFHTVRSNARYLLNNLEEYKMNGLLVITV